MQYFDLFATTAKAFVDTLDSATNIKFYKRWKRIFASSELDGAAIEQSIKDFIANSLPKETQVSIASILPYSSPDKIAKWLQSAKVSCFDTMQGLYINVSDIERVKSLSFEYSPIAPQFQTQCSQYGISVSYSDTYHFVRSLPKEMVYKCSNHPVHGSEHKEFYSVNNADKLISLIDRWCALYKAHLPSPRTGFISLSDAASGCDVDSAVMLDWLQNYHVDSIICIDGQVIVQSVLATNLFALKPRLVSVDDAITNWFVVYVPPKGFKTKLRELIVSQIQLNAPDWMIDAGAYPGISHLQFIDSQKIEAAYTSFSVWTDELPCLAINTLLPVTNLSVPKIKKLIEIGTIPAQKEKESYYLSKSTFHTVKRYNETHVVIDDLVEGIGRNVGSKFSVKLTKHRQDLKDFLDHSEVCEDLIINNQWLYPMDAKLTGLLLPIELISVFESAVTLWLKCYQRTYSEMVSLIMDEMAETFPRTAWFVRGKGPKEKDKSTCDMLLTMMHCMQKSGKDLADLPQNERDLEIENNLVPVFNYCSIVSANKFADFIYTAGLTKKMFDFNTDPHHRDSSAYSREAFAYMVMAVVRDDFRDRHDLINKAISDHRCARLWLNIAMHIVSAWRTTDYARLPVPILPYNDQLTLKKISEGTFTPNEAKLVAELYETRVNDLEMKPNKTEKYDYVRPLYFHIPESCKEPFGIIFAIAAAHYGLNNCESSGEPYYEDICDVSTIQQFFGPGFVEACGNRNFSGKRANKSFLQGFEQKAQEDGIGPYTAFMMTSDIRSHKYDKDFLSRITTIYLEDGKFSGYSKEYIVEQMFERGIMSFITYGLLSMTYGESFDNLPIHKQTDIIKDIGLTASRVDDIVQCTMSAETAAIKAIQTTLAQPGSKSPKETLETLVLGDASSKDMKTICLCHGAGVPCKCPNRLNCLGCLYEVRSKNVLLHYLLNYDRQLQIINSKADAPYSELEVSKAKWLIKKVLKPGIVEIQACINASTSKEEVEAYAWILKERMRQHNECIYINGTV